MTSSPSPTLELELFDVNRAVENFDRRFLSVFGAWLGSSKLPSLAL